MAILILGAVCAVALVAASESAGDPLGAQSRVAVALEGLVSALYVVPGFLILAVAARWMSVLATGITLALMIAVSVWASLEMWNASSALAGLAIIVPMLALPPLASAGALLDIGGRALGRRLRTAH